MSQDKNTNVDATGLVGFAPSHVIKMTTAYTDQLTTEGVFLTCAALLRVPETPVNFNKLQALLGTFSLCYLSLVVH